MTSSSISHYRVKIIVVLRRYKIYLAKKYLLLYTKTFNKNKVDLEKPYFFNELVNFAKEEIIIIEEINKIGVFVSNIKITVFTK